MFQVIGARIMESTVGRLAQEMRISGRHGMRHDTGDLIGRRLGGTLTSVVIFTVDLVEASNETVMLR